MDVTELAKRLDQEFKIKQNAENLVEWAVTDENRSFINPDFTERKTGLMVKNAGQIEKVFTVVFITDVIMNKMRNYTNSLILTHHNFNYYEDERGLRSIRPSVFTMLAENKNSIYVAHAPLDTHPIYGTSKCLAELCGVAIDEYFFDYFGAPTALIGHVGRETFESFSERIKGKIQRPYLTLAKNADYVEKIAVVAGGGDMPDILEYAYKAGCDTLLTGTVQHRWNVPFIQEGNKKFHELNKKLKLNLIGGTHFATERPAMIKATGLLKGYGMDCEYLEDEGLLNAE
jgi:putative NIF3 family GTP cyclohydrolase 1 type 2